MTVAVSEQRRKSFANVKADHSRKFDTAISAINSLSFVRSPEHLREISEKCELVAMSKPVFVPLKTANGSTVYRKVAPTQTATTVAQPKVTLPQTVPNNLQKSNILASMAGYFYQGVSNLGRTVRTSIGTPISFKPAVPVKVMATITTDDLNVRSGPGTSHKKVSKLNKGDKVEIIGKNTDDSWLKINLSGHTDTWIKNNPAWVSTGSLKNVPVVTVGKNKSEVKPSYPKPIVFGKYSTSQDAATRDTEDKILSVLAANPPFDNTLGTWVATLASGYHDENAFNALDLGLGSNADKGKDVVAVASGTISKIDLSFGSILIDHPKDSSTPTWQSNYLHMPLYKTDRVTEEGKTIYVLHNADTKNDKKEFVEGTEMEGFEIWEGKKVSAGDKIGIIAGRGRSTLDDAGLDEENINISDASFTDHLHFEARIDGKSINLALLAMHGWNATVKGMQNGTADVQWSNAIDIGNMGGAWVNEDQKLIFFRDPAITANADNDYWLAWEPNKTVGEMEKVVWKEVDRITVNNKEQGVMRWVKADSTIWTDGNNVWIPNLQSWSNYQK